MSKPIGQGNAARLPTMFRRFPTPTSNQPHQVPNNLPNVFPQHVPPQQIPQYNHYAPRSTAPANLNQQMHTMHNMHTAVSSHNGSMQVNFQQQRPANITPNLPPQMMFPYQHHQQGPFQVWPSSNVNVMPPHPSNVPSNHPLIQGITYIAVQRPPQLQQAQILTPTSQHQQSQHQQYATPQSQSLPPYTPQPSTYVSQHQQPGPGMFKALQPKNDQVSTPQPQPPPQKPPPPAPRNRKVIPIIDPKTNRNVLEDDDLVHHQPAPPTPPQPSQQQVPRQSLDIPSSMGPPPQVETQHHHHHHHHHLPHQHQQQQSVHLHQHTNTHHMEELPPPLPSYEEGVSSLDHHQLPNMLPPQAAPIRIAPPQILQRPQTLPATHTPPPSSSASSTPSPVVQSHLVSDNIESLHSHSHTIPTVSALSTGPEVDLADLNQKVLSTYPNHNHLPSTTVYTLLKRPAHLESPSLNEMKSSSQSQSPEELQPFDNRLRVSVEDFHYKVEEGAPPSPPPLAPPDPVVEKTPSPVITPDIEVPLALPTPQPPVQPKLKHSYLRDQWSPINQDGFKKYSRDFLIQLKNEAMSKPKPANLPDLEIVLKDLSKSSSIAKNTSMPHSHNSIYPPYAKQGNIKPNNSYKQQPLLKSRSMGGKVANKPVPKALGVACISISLKDEIKLREAENAWRPNNVIDEEEKLYKRVRGMLNKLTPDNFESLKEKFKELPINTAKRLEKVIDIMFQKAIAEPNFSEFYAKMCYEMMKQEVIDETKPVNADGRYPSVNFKNLMLNKCQQEFEKHEHEEDVNVSRLREIEAETDPEKQKELRLVFEEEERLIRKRSVGNCRFIGELYKLNMLTTKIMHHCLDTLLNKAEEEALERACKLLSTIGKDLETHANDKDTALMRGYFSTMEDLASKKNTHCLSSRVRFMLQDVIDLRKNKWVPRRNENRPKTIQQIAYEAESEKQAINSMNKKLDMKPLESDRRAAFQATQKDWKPHPPQFKTNFVIDKSKLLMRDSQELKLGPSNKNVWHQGSNINKPTDSYASDSTYGDPRGAKSAPRKVLPPPTSTENRYSVLHNNNNITSSSNSDSKSEPNTMRSSAHKDSSDSKDKRKLVKIYMEEYFYNNDYNELMQSAQKQDISSLEFCSHALELGCQKSSEEYHRRVGDLLSVLHKRLPITNEAVNTALLRLLQNTIDNDLYTDTPHLSKYIAEIIAPLVETNVITFSEIRSSSQCLRTEEHDFYRQSLFKELLKILGYTRAPSWVQQKWNLSKMKLSDIVSNSESCAAAFPYFFVGSMSRADYSSVIKKSSRTEQDLKNRIRDVILSHCQNPCDIVNLCEDLVNWTKGNFGSLKLESLYYRALTNALLLCCISKSKEKLIMPDYTKFIHVYKLLSLTEKQEVEVLNAVFLLVKNLEFPRGLLLDCFKCLHREGAISDSSFKVWGRSDQVDKGVAMKQLTGFFQSLDSCDPEE